jgi:succinate dehydrogenase hydrophobic anchor subunit
MRRTGIILILLVGLVIAMMYQSRDGIKRPWMNCKESLMSQMLTGKCTPIERYLQKDKQREL